MLNKPPKILVIKSKLSELERVEVFLYDIFKEYNLPKAQFNKVFLCVSEAAVNSIEHGNKNDSNKTVSIGVDCTSQSIYLEIKDEGEGFSLKDVEDPTSISNLRKETGRGIHIIKSLSDKIEYNDKGNGIQIKINC